MMDRPPQTQFVFSDFLLAPSQRQLRRADVPVSLTPLSFDILQLLVERPQQLVETAEIYRKIWGQAARETANLTGRIGEIRTALDDMQKPRRFIETVHGFGYRFCHSVETLVVHESETPSETDVILTPPPDSTASNNEYNEQIADAKKADRLGRYEEAKAIWKDLSLTASRTENKKLLIQARLEIAHIEMSEDTFDVDNALNLAKECLEDSKTIDLGEDVGRIYQLIGEIHRFKGNLDQAAAFIRRSLEFALTTKDKHAEGWAYFALAMISNESKEPIELQFEHITNAFNAFTDLELSDKKNSAELANQGYALCYMLRGKFYGYEHYEQALAEYSRSIEIYRDMGSDWEFELARLLLERGEMQAVRDYWQQGLKDILAASEIFERLDDHYGVAKGFLITAELLDKRGVRKESLAYYGLAVNEANEIPDKRKRAWFYFRYSMKMLELGHHEEARRVMLILLASNAVTGSQKLDVLKRLSDLARVTQNEEELRQCEEHTLSLIEELISEAKSPDERLRLIFSKGQAQDGLKQYDSALETFESAARLAKSLSKNERLADIWASIAQVHMHLKNRAEQRSAYERVLGILVNREESPQFVTTLANFAQLEFKERNFKEANELLDRAEKLCKKVMPFLMFFINEVRQDLGKAESEP